MSNAGICYVAGDGWSYGGGDSDGRSHVGGGGDDDEGNDDGDPMVASYCSDVLMMNPVGGIYARAGSSTAPYPTPILPPPPGLPPPSIPGGSSSAVSPAVAAASSSALSMSREVPQNCPYCNKVISNFYNLKKHISTMHRSPAIYQTCTHCSATFRTPEYLRKHLVNVHKYPVKKKK